MKLLENYVLILEKREVSLSPFNRWEDYNSDRTGYLSQVTPLIRSWARVWKPFTRLSPGHFLRLPLFLNRWSASSASFVPLLSSKLWLQLSLLPLCPGSIWLWDFYLPAFVFDIMIMQHLIWSLVLIYFLALIPETNSKEQHTVIRYQQSDFYQGCRTLEFIIPSKPAPAHSHGTTYGHNFCGSATHLPAKPVLHCRIRHSQWMVKIKQMGCSKQ